MMNSRDRMKAILEFQVPDRIGILDAPWPETVARWRLEGLPASVSPHEYFDFDVEYCLNLNTSFMLQKKVLEESDEFVVFSDSNGAVKKYWLRKTGAHAILDHPIKHEEDWKRLKPLLCAGMDRVTAGRWGEYSLPEERVIGSALPSWEDTLSKYEDSRRRGKFVFLFVNGPFETANNCFHAEELYMGLVESPHLFEDIFHTVTELIVETFLLVKGKGIEVDGIFLGDDIAYKNGMLFSPGTYRSLLLPCYRRLCSFFKEHGLTVSFHTDGNLDEALPLLLDAGITAIQPLEAKAGNDVRELKSVYGDRVVFFGNIDVRALSGDRSDIEREIESKVTAAKEGGGYIYHSDHSVPPTVSFDNYCYAMELVKNYGCYKNID